MRKLRKSNRQTDSAQLSQPHKLSELPLIDGDKKNSKDRCSRKTRETRDFLDRLKAKLGPEISSYLLYPQQICKNNPEKQLSPQELRRYGYRIGFRIASKSEARKVFLAKPGVREMLSEKVKSTMTKPEIRERLSAMAKVTGAKPQVRANRSKAMKAVWEEPRYRKKISEKVSEKLTAIYANPEVRAAYSIKVKEQWKDPEYREKRARGLKKAYNNPEYRIRLSKAMKKVWADPERRAKIYATMNTPKTPTEIQIRHKIVHLVNRKTGETIDVADPSDLTGQAAFDKVAETQERANLSKAMAALHKESAKLYEVVCRHFDIGKDQNIKPSAETTVHLKSEKLEGLLVEGLEFLKKHLKN